MILDIRVPYPFSRLFKMLYNGLGIAEVGAFKEQMFNLVQMLIRITNVQI